MKKPTPIELVERAARFTTDDAVKMARLYGVPVEKCREIIAAVRHG